MRRRLWVPYWGGEGGESVNPETISIIRTKISELECDAWVDFPLSNMGDMWRRSDYTLNKLKDYLEEAEREA